MAYTTIWKSGQPNLVRIEAQVAADADLSQWSNDAILSPIQDLASLAAHGGMSGTTYPPDSAQCQLTQGLVSGRNVLWTMQFANVSALLLDAVEGALAYFDHAIGELSSATVEAPAPMLAQRKLEPEGHFPGLPFNLVDDRQLFQGGFTVLITLQHDADQNLLETLEEATFGAWFCAGSSGSFCSDAYPPDVVCFFMDDPGYSADALEITLEDSVIPEPTAWQSLINTLVWAHKRIVPIKQVELFEA